MSLRILLHDNHLLAVAKPAGVPCVADSSGDPSLHEQAKAWLKAEHGKPGEVFLGVVHRLDRPVSGVVLFARTSKAAGRLAEQWRSRSVAKFYLGVVEGRVSGEPGAGGEIEHWLLKDGTRNLVRAVPPGTAGARLASTRWRIRAQKGAHTLLELETLTGRPHQLRVACAAMGHPLAGDLKYGARSRIDDRSIALHAARLDCEHPTLREALRIEAPPPRLEPWRAFV